MKQLRTFRLLVVCIMMFCNLNLFADGLITEQVVVNVEEAGTLSTKISNADKYRITDLKIIGKLNGSDFDFIHTFAEGDDKKLKALDLSEVELVPDEDDGTNIRVTENNTIPNSSFSGCSGLTSIILPPYITSIGQSAFGGCSGLMSLVLPSGVTSIGWSAFRGCSSLTNLVLPDGITSVDENTFRNCCSLTSLVLPEGITFIGSSAFYGCSGLTSIFLPESLTSIHSSAFRGCSSLTNLVFPQGLTSIGTQAFLGCSGLNRLVLPESLTSVGVDAFWGCSGLANLVLPESLTVIGNYAFRNCSGLNSITFLSSSITIRLNSFSGCNNLRSLCLASNEYVDIIGLGKSGISKDCVLYVPQDLLQAYKSSAWGEYFDNIVEYDATGIDDVSTSSSVKPLSRYSVNGQRLTTPAKGLNIVKYSDGSVRKEMVK